MLFVTLAPVRCTRQTIFCLSFCLFRFCLSILFLIVSFLSHFSGGNVVIWPPVELTTGKCSKWLDYYHKLELDSDDKVSGISLDCYSTGSEFTLVEPCVRGRLANAFEFWEKDLEAPPFDMDIIGQGYSLPFSEFPPRCFQSNNHSALRNP